MPTAKPDLSGIRFVTFDCYGTLVDWVGGVAGFVRGLLARRNRRDVDPLAFVATWERIQRRLIEPPYRRYAEILEASLGAALSRYGLAPERNDALAFAASMGDWPPFPEVPDALRRAATMRPLVLVSNTDRAILERTMRLLAAPIHRSITAEESGHYKPAVEAFAFALRSLGARPEEVLHVSAYDEYDLIPAARLGMRTIGVSRDGAPDPPSAPVDAMIGSLGELPAILAGIRG